MECIVARTGLVIELRGSAAQSSLDELAAQIFDTARYADGTTATFSVGGVAYGAYLFNSMDMLNRPPHDYCYICAGVDDFASHAGRVMERLRSGLLKAQVHYDPSDFGGAGAD